MDKTEPTAAAGSAASQIQPLRLGKWLTGRRALIALAAVALTSGALLNWDWLVAAGIAPVLIALVPCAAMCAFGLCANKLLGRESCSIEHSPPPARADNDNTAVPTQPVFEARGKEELR